MDRVGHKLDIETFEKGPALEWEGFTDQVMGGRSEISGIDVLADRELTFLRMEGRVSLDNGGGFIQARAKFPGGRLDATGWKGFEIRLRGVPGSYELHLRTPRCHMPWSYFGALLPVARGWTEAYIAFDDFSGTAIAPGPLETGNLLSLGFLAIGEEFDARLDIARVSLYR